MALDHGPLLRIEGAGLAEDRVRDADLAHVMEEPGAGERAQLVRRQLHGSSNLDRQLGHPRVVAPRVLVFGFDRGGECGDRFRMFELQTDLDFQLERGFQN